MRSPARLACLLVPHFVAEAVLRAEPALRDRPLVVLDAHVPARLVVEATVAARAHGVRPGMTEAAAQARPAPLVCRVRDPAREAEAQRALLEVALAHSPRVEEGGPGCVYLDVAGLEGLFGDEPTLARRLAERAAATGLPARVGIAGSRIAARLAARRSPGVSRIPPGREAAWLAPAPLACLDGAPEVIERLARWGLRTLGDLAALPAPDLFERLGAEGLALRALARGEDPRPLRPWQPPRVLEEMRDLDWAVDDLETLCALFHGLAAAVSGRLERERLVADTFQWACRLETGPDLEGMLVPAVPTREPGAAMVMLRAALEARPPGAGVTAVILRAHPTRVPPAQEGLAARARPHPRALAETVARLTALVGDGRVGTPVLLDSHRPDAMGMTPFRLVPPRPGASEAAARARPVLALRRLRPPRPAAVRLVGGRPVHLRAERAAGAIVASGGPWRASGEWWSEGGWLRDEWDVELQDGTLCRLAHDGGRWLLDGVYD